MDGVIHNSAGYFTCVFSFTDLNGHFSLTNYEQILSMKYLKMMWDSIFMQRLITIITLLISYPVAYSIRSSKIKICGCSF